MCLRRTQALKGKSYDVQWKGGDDYHSHWVAENIDIKGWWSDSYLDMYDNGREGTKTGWGLYTLARSLPFWMRVAGE